MTHYKNPRDPRLLAECSKVRKDAVPCKVWSPDGTFFTATCATHEEIAGSLVAGGMPQEEYWPQVVAGYRSSVRAYQDQSRYHVALIEHLEARLMKTVGERDEALNQLDSARHSVDVLENRVKNSMSEFEGAANYIEELETKMAKAVDALKHAKLNMPHPDQLIDDTLAELEGGKE